MDLQGSQGSFVEPVEPKKEPLAGRVVSIDALRGFMMFWIIGTNAIFVYMATHLLNFRNIAAVFVGGLDRFVGPWRDFIHPLAGFAIVWLILFWMYRKKTFIKV